MTRRIKIDSERLHANKIDGLQRVKLRAAPATDPKRTAALLRSRPNTNSAMNKIQNADKKHSVQERLLANRYVVDPVSVERRELLLVLDAFIELREVLLIDREIFQEGQRMPAASRTSTGPPPAMLRQDVR